MSADNFLHVRGTQVLYGDMSGPEDGSGMAVLHSAATFEAAVRWAGGYAQHHSIEYGISIDENDCAPISLDAAGDAWTGRSPVPEAQS